MSAVYGTSGKLALGASSATSRLEFEVCGVKMREEIANFAGVQGHRGELAGRNRLGNVAPGGPIEFTPNPAEWAILLPFILGGTPSGTSYPLAEALPTFVLDVDDSVSCKQYTGCVFSSATISGTAGGPIKLSTMVEAVDEGSDTFPALSIDATYGPFMFYEGAFTIAGVSSVTPFDFQIQIDNVIDVGRYLNSRTRTSLKARGRRVNFTCSVPYGDYYSNLYGIQGSEVAVVATFTSAAMSLAFTMPKLRIPREGPDGRQREDELKITLSGACRKTNSTTDELQVVLDSTA